MSGDAGRFPGAALPFLRCPVCAAGLAPAERSLRCGSGHNFDVAHQGYVNLLPGGARPGTADTAEMVAAREAFLAAGHYEAVRRFVCDAAERALEAAGDAAPRAAAGSPERGCIVEAGAGTGYYLAGVLDRLPGRVGLALDISKFAARRAARAHERMAAVVCDAWRELPIVDVAASLVLDVFAPRNPFEFRRVLRPDGALLVIVPTQDHLAELVAALGLVSVDERKPERLAQAMEGLFATAWADRHEQEMGLTPEQAGALVAMGPSARHLSSEELARRLAALGSPIRAKVSVVATAFLPLGAR